MSLVLFGALSIIEVFFSMSLALAPSMGCDPRQGYLSQKSIRLKRGLQMIYFSLVNGL
jgi:hypothetical protein